MSAPPTDTFHEAVRELREAAYRRAVDGPGLEVLAPLLKGRLALRPHTLDLAADALSRDTVHLLLTSGWTPTELHTFADRRLDSVAMTYLVDALAAASQITVAPPWSGELADLRAHVWWTVSRPHLTQWSERHGFKRPDTVRWAVEVLGLLSHIPRAANPLPLAPAPIELQPGTLVRDTRIAGKIDALLSRAADTTFPAEAEACVAKAQELMVRYATIPDFAPTGPVAAATAAAMEQLVKEGPMVVAKTLNAFVRFNTSLSGSFLEDPRRFVGSLSEEMLHLFRRLAAALNPIAPPAPTLPRIRPMPLVLDAAPIPSRR